MTDVFLKYLLYQAPLFLALLVSLFLSLFNIRKYRKVSLMILASSAIVLFKIIIVSLLYASLIDRESLEEQQNTFVAVSFIDALLTASVWVYMIVAAYSKRVLPKEPEVQVTTVEEDLRQEKS